MFVTFGGYNSNEQVGPILKGMNTKEREDLGLALFLLDSVIVSESTFQSAVPKKVRALSWMFGYPRSAGLTPANCP